MNVSMKKLKNAFDCCPKNQKSVIYIYVQVINDSDKYIRTYFPGIDRNLAWLNEYDDS